MRLTTRITVGAAVAVAVAGSVTTPAALSAEGRAAKQIREVCAQSVYVKKSPGAIPVGSVTRGEKVQVTRYSRSGAFAHVVARRPAYTTRGWVPRRYLCPKGKRAEFARTPHRTHRPHDRHRGVI